MSSIGQFIREIRKERSLSQKELAEISGVSIAVLSRIENGDLKVNASSLNNILKVFGYEVGGVRKQSSTSRVETKDDDDFMFEEELS